MGCRISRRNNEISESRDTNAIKFLEEDISSSSKHTANVSTSPIQSLVLEVLNVVRMLTERFVHGIIAQAFPVVNFSRN